MSGLGHILNVTRSADWEVEEEKKKENWFLTKVQDIVLQRVKELPTTHQFSVSATFMPCCFMFRKEKNYIYKDGLVWSVV